MTEVQPQCRFCKYAIVSDEWLDSDIFDEVETSLRCTNKLNIGSGRNINSGSGRLVSMDTELKPPYASFEVDDDNYCVEFKLDERIYKESEC